MIEQDARPESIGNLKPNFDFTDEDGMLLHESEIGDEHKVYHKAKLSSPLAHNR